jgi:hypothetical protein
MKQFIILICTMAIVNSLIGPTKYSGVEHYNPEDH